MVAGNKVTGKIHNISWGSHYLFDIYSLLFMFLQSSPNGPVLNTPRRWIHTGLKPFRGSLSRKDPSISKFNELVLHVEYLYKMVLTSGTLKHFENAFSREDAFSNNAYCNLNKSTGMRSVCVTDYNAYSRLLRC